MGIPSDLMQFFRKRAYLPATSYEVTGPDGFTIGVERGEGEAPDLDGGAVSEAPRKPLVAQSAAATVSGDDNDERGRGTGILDELSQGIDVEERAALNDPRASASAQDARNRSDRQSNIFLQAAGLAPLTKQDDPYVSERDKMRDWLMKRAGVAGRGEANALNSERTKAYLDSIQAAREREIAGRALRAEKDGNAAEMARLKLELEQEKARTAKEQGDRKLKIEEEKARRKAAPKPPAAPGSNTKSADDLRKEFNALPDTKNFGEVDASFRKIQEAASNPSAAGDLALITGYMKVIDPGSSVKEGEFANAQNAGGVPDKVKSAYNNLINGERLTPEQRADFVSASKVLYDVHKSRYEDQVKRYRSLAEKRNASPDDVIALPDGKAAPAASGDTVKVRRKKDGMVKVFKRTEASKYLSDPAFEEVK